MGLMMGLMMGLLGAPAFGFACKMKGNIARFEERKAKFAAGKGRNPETDPMGPHRSFAQNAIMGGLLFGTIGLFAGNMAS